MDFGFDDANTMQRLVELFRTPNDPSDSSDEEEVKPQKYKAATPATIGDPKKERKCKSKYLKVETEEKETPKSMEELEEGYFEGPSDGQGSGDWRKTPQWDIKYKQVVTPNDVFLQMTNRTNATSSCEDMIISVDLPGEKRQNIDLKITRNQLNLISPNFRLNIPLPQEVDPQKGSAEFDSDTQKMKITLRMDREFDYVNF